MGRGVEPDCAVAILAGMGMDSEEAARAAQLRYVSDSRPGIRRRVAGTGFMYIDGQDAPVEDEAVLGRIRALAIPPAWTEVWICKLSHGHLQASGRDARGRKQYRYHARWRKIRDEAKYDRMLKFGAALPRIRDCVEGHLRLTKLTREKVLGSSATPPRSAAPVTSIRRSWRDSWMRKSWPSGRRRRRRQMSAAGSPGMKSR